VGGFAAMANGITQPRVQRKALAVLEARASPLAPRESVERGQDVGAHHPNLPSRN
jgi:hypothetical protein